MATTISDTDKLKIIRYFGGVSRGVCYDFVDKTDPTNKRTCTLTEETLLRVIQAHDSARRG